MFRVLISAAVLVFSGASAMGQVIYEAVQYQYHFATPGGPVSFYYGGSDARVLAMDGTAGPGCVSSTSRVQGGQVFCDELPGTDVSAYGFTATDARNRANANVPRYFRKSDLLTAATRDADGMLHVAAQAQPRQIIVAPGVPALPASPATAPTTAPAIPSASASAPRGITPAASGASDNRAADTVVLIWR